VRATAWFGGPGLRHFVASLVVPFELTAEDYGTLQTMTADPAVPGAPADGAHVTVGQISPLLADLAQHVTTGQRALAAVLLEVRGSALDGNRLTDDPARVYLHPDFRESASSRRIACPAGILVATGTPDPLRVCPRFLLLSVIAAGHALDVAWRPRVRQVVRTSHLLAVPRAQPSPTRAGEERRGPH
jgi:hypothetical protein